jgi:hypothetical protein
MKSNEPKENEKRETDTGLLCYTVGSNTDLSLVFLDLGHPAANTICPLWSPEISSIPTQIHRSKPSVKNMRPDSEKAIL